MTLKPFLEDMLSMSTGTDGHTLQIHFSRPVTVDDRLALMDAHNYAVTRPAAPVEGLERYDISMFGNGIVEMGGGQYVRFDQAEAIIAAERVENSVLRKEVDRLQTKAMVAVDVTRDLEANNAALTAKFKKITDALSNVIVINEVGHYVNDAVVGHIFYLETQLSEAKKALGWYANPEIYKPHPHGVAFDNRDVSYVARAALEAKP